MFSNKTQKLLALQNDYIERINKNAVKLDKQLNFLMEIQSHLNKQVGGSTITPAQNSEFVMKRTKLGEKLDRLERESVGPKKIEITKLKENLNRELPEGDELTNLSDIEKLNGFSAELERIGTGTTSPPPSPMNVDATGTTAQVSTGTQGSAETQGSAGSRGATVTQGATTGADRGATGTQSSTRPAVPSGDFAGISNVAKGNLADENATASQEAVDRRAQVRTPQGRIVGEYKGRHDNLKKQIAEKREDIDSRLIQAFEALPQPSATNSQEELDTLKALYEKIIRNKSRTQQARGGPVSPRPDSPKAEEFVDAQGEPIDQTPLPVVSTVLGTLGTNVTKFQEAQAYNELLNGLMDAQEAQNTKLEESLKGLKTAIGAMQQSSKDRVKRMAAMLQNSQKTATNVSMDDLTGDQKTLIKTQLDAVTKGTATLDQAVETLFGTQ